VSDLKMIPDEALAAAARAIGAETYVGNQQTLRDAARAAIAAALEAWPGMDVERFMPDSGPYTIHLPLPQGGDDE
jgi:hypothetical protein